MTLKAFMNEINVGGLTQLVLWVAFALSVVFGAIARRTHFCAMGAIADIVSMNDWKRARMWALAVATAVLGFNAMVAMGWIEAGNSIYAGPRLLWLSVLVGGLMFGFGMVLASGCGARNLVRLGGGNLKSLVVLLVMATTASATLRGLTAVWRVDTVERVFVELPGGQDVPSLLSHVMGAATGMTTPMLAALVGGLVTLALLVWVLRRPEGRSRETWLGGFGIGAVIVGVWWVSGCLGYLPEDPNTLEPAFLATNSHHMEALSMAAPLAYAFEWVQFYSDASRTLTLGIVAMFGVVLGAFIVALAERSFRWEGFAGVEDLASHLMGATLMGVGGVVTMGCTVGQGLSGVSTLSIGSVIAVLGIGSGAWFGLRWRIWRLERSA